MDEERLVEDLKFKEMCKLQIFNTNVDDAIPSERYNIVVACNKYGYLYIGYNKGLKIVKTAELTRLNSTVDKSKETVTDYPHVDVQLGYMPHHLALSADNLTLAVCYKKDAALIIALYDVRSLIQLGTNAKALSTQILSQGSDVWVTELCWNPTNLTVLATCLSDGSLILCETSAGVRVVAKIQKDNDSRAMCWSPKGKQLVVGKGDGSLVQYDLQLTEKRRIQKPYTFDDRVTVVDVCWLSTYKFIAAYADTDGRLQPNVVTVSAPKDGDPMFNNFEDICMGEGERKGQYYLKYIDKWEILLAMQSNGADMGLMGKQQKNPNQWEIWNVNDNARLTLPLNANNDDTYPLGIALDLTSELNQSGGRPAPIVITLSTEGKLCPFYMLYDTECPVITAPPVAFPPGQRQPSGSGGGDAVVPSMPASVASKQIQSASSIGGGHAQTSVPNTASIQSMSSSTAPVASFSFTTPTATSAAGLSFGAKPTSVPFGQPSGSNSGGFSFTSKTAPASGHPQATGMTGFSFGQSSTASSSSPFSFAPKSTTSSSNVSLAGSTPPVSNPGSMFSSQSKGAFTPPAVTTQLQTAGAQSAAISQSTFSLSGASSSFSFSAPKPPPQAEPVSAFSQPATKPTGFSFISAAGSESTSFGQLTKPTAPGLQTQSGASVNVIKPVAEVASIPGQGARAKTVPQLGVQQTRAKAFSTPQDHAAPATPVSQFTVPVVTTPQPTKPSVVQATNIKQGAATETLQTTQTSPGSEKLQSVFSAKIKEEMELFSRELKSLRQRSTAGNYVIGTENEKKYLRASIDKLTEFRQESVEVTKSINEDIHHLKSDTLNAFSLIEEVKLREQRNNDPRYVYFLKARSLDPATLKKMQEIRSKHHNLEVGLKDVNACLDAAWEEQQLSRGRKKRVMKSPTLDAVYQTLSNHHNIISNLQEQLKVVKQRLREAQSYDISAWPSPQTPVPEASQDVEMSSVTKSMSRTRISDQVQHTPISAKKMSQIKDLLSQRSSTPIRSVKKSNLSQTIRFSNSPLVQEAEQMSARPLNLARELDIVDGNKPSRVQSSSQPAKVEQKQQSRQSVANAAVREELPKPKPMAQPPPTSPALKTTSGKTTVEWGASTKGKLTPSQAAGVAAVNRLNSQQMAEAVMISQTTPAQKDLPPVVNIGKLDSMKESMPPPVTFAPVGSSVNAGTAKVLNDVIAEMAMASGKTTQQFTRGPKSPAAQLSPASLPKSLENLAKPQPTSVASVGLHPNISAPMASSAKAFTIKPDASAFSLTSPASSQAASIKTAVTQSVKTTLTGSTTNPSASSSSGPSSFPSFGFSSVSSGFGNNKGASSPQTGFNFGASVEAAALPSTKTTASVANTGFSFSKPLGQQTAATSSASLASGSTSGFSFGSLATSTSIATTTPASSFSFGAPAPSSSSSLGFSFNKPSNSGSPFGDASNQKPSTPLSSTSLSKEEVPKSAIASTGKTTAAGSALSVDAKAQELHFPHQESSPTQVVNTKGDIQKTSAVRASTAPTGAKDIAASSVAPTSESQSSSKSLMGLLAADDEPTPTTSSTSSFSFTASSSTSGFSFGKPTAASSANLSASSAPSTTPPFSFTPTSGFAFGKPSDSTIATATTASSTMSAGFSFVQAATSSTTSSTAITAAPTTGFSFGQVGSSTAATSTASAAPTTLATGIGFGQVASSTAATTTGAVTTPSATGFGFGQVGPSAAATTTGAVPTTSATGFGQAGSSAATTTTGAALTSSATGFGFGQVGSSTAATTTGAVPTTPSSGSLFGQTSSAFGSVTFGNKANTGSSFGSTSLFGSSTGGTDDCGTGKPASSGFSFSSASDASKNVSLPFGQSTSQASAFGQNPSFGSAQQSSSNDSPFGASSSGGMFSGLGGKPNPENAKVNPFGVAKSDSTPAFGGSSLFGKQKDTKFGGTDEAGAFGSQGPFSSNTSGFGFGQATSPVKGASGFGNPPSFGSTAFGGSSFGSTPSFSSPIGASTFGSTSGGFSAFASNDSVGFGNIANQGTASFAAMSSNNQPSAFGAGFGQQNQTPAFGASNAFGAPATSPFGGGGGGSPFGGGGGGGGGGSPFGNNTQGSSPSFSGWR
ncbi:uncharacterized protein [Antedon mediterranea]|uniref:uncharacterized protein n=1 Tax=Antedon mediterranea TaxID=105859 RepID=UPI003AF7794A